MARLTAISGFGRKSAAAFLLELDASRILLDIGGGLEVGENIDLAGVGEVDAIVLSHAHVDHVGALGRAGEIGNPPIYATARTLAALPAELLPETTVTLPEEGQAHVAGLPVTLGRTGHSPGGIWIRFDTDAGGVLYSGDFCFESDFLPADPFVAAATLVLDASYGDRDERLEDQIADLARHALSGAVLPCPPMGRGPEMYLRLEQLGLPVHACPTIAAEIEAHCGRPARRVDAETADIGQVIVADGPDATEGLAAQLAGRPGFRFIFSGHVPETSPAQRMLQAGQATWSGWNVHPRRSDILDLVGRLQPKQVMPAFTNLAKAPLLAQGLGQRLVTTQSIEV